MNQETLNLFLFIFLAIITGCIVVVAVFFIMALKTFMRMSEQLNETALSFRDKLQFKALAALPAILLTLVRNIRKRG